MRSRPDAASAWSSVAVTSEAHMVGPSLQATMKREKRRQIIPAPASNLEVGDVRLPELVDGGGLVLELLCRLDHHIGRAGDQVVRLQQPIDRCLRDKILPLIGEPYRQLSRRQLGNLQRHIDDLAANIVRDAIPDAIRPGPVISQRLRPSGTIAIVTIDKMWRAGRR